MEVRNLYESSYFAPCMKQLVFELSVLLLCVVLPGVFAVEITEIMYNPQGNDNNQEFVEVFGVNLSNWTITDNVSSDVLELVQEGNSSYSLIVEEGFDYSKLNCSIYSIGSAIGNGLSLGEVISLWFNDTQITNQSIGFAPEGFSSLPNGTGEVLGGTPCEDEPLVVVKENLTCDAQLQVFTDKQVYEKNEKVALQTVVQGVTDFTLEYWVEYLDGTIVKQSRSTTNTNDKSWTIPNEDTVAVYYFVGVLDGSCVEEPVEERVLFVRSGVEVAEETVLEADEVQVANGILSFVLDAQQGDSRSNKVAVRIRRNGHTFKRYDYELNSFMGELYYELPCDGNGEVTVEGYGLDVRESFALPACPGVVTKEKDECVVVESVPSLQSFYTRKEKVEEDMTLYSYVRTDQQVNLTLCSLLDTVVVNETQRVDFDVSLESGSNEFQVFLVNDTTGFGSAALNFTYGVGKEEAPGLAVIEQARLNEKDVEVVEVDYNTTEKLEKILVTSNVVAQGPQVNNAYVAGGLLMVLLGGILVLVWKLL